MERAFRALTALCAFAGLGIQLWILLQSPDFASPLLAVWRYLAFFTILTNLIVAVTAAVSAIAPGSAPGQLVATPQARAAVLVYISVVFGVYHVLLAGLWDPQGWQLVADQLLHTATPLLVAIGWAAFDAKKGLRFAAIPAILIYPIGYTVYAMVRGAMDGFYPYFFIDVPTYGYARVLMYIGALTGGFVAVSGVVIGLGQLLAGPDVKPKKKWES